MNSGTRDYRDHNFTFFKELLLEPALEQGRFVSRESDRSTFYLYGSNVSDQVSPILTAIGLFETTLWLRLGIELDYFYDSTVIETLSSLESELSAAWTVIVKNEVRLASNWCDFMSREPEPKFVKDEFLKPSLILEGLRDLSSPEYFEQMRRYLLGCLLLTSEILFDPRVLSFLAVIGWGSDELVEDILSGHRVSTSYSLEEIYLGFANHVTYFRRLGEHLFHNFEQSPVTDVAPGSNYNVGEGLYTSVMRIVSARQLLYYEQAKTRCLRLGSNIAAMLYQPLPEWQRTRELIFSNVFAAIGYPSDPDKKYWRDFVNTTETMRRTMREARPEGSAHFTTE